MLIKNERLRRCGGKHNNIHVYSILLIVLIILFSITVSAQSVVMNPKIPKAMICLLDDIAKGAVKSQSAKHADLLVKMGKNIDGYIPLINKYPTQERANILLEVLKSKNLAKPTETLVIKGKIARGELQEADIINAIKNNKNIYKSEELTKKTLYRSESSDKQIGKAKANAKMSSIGPQNKAAGMAREKIAENILNKKYQAEKGYRIQKEQYLRDKNGQIVRDPQTGEARRLDFIVVKDGKVVKSVEVTSKTAPKDSQLLKEGRIRDSDGNYIKDKITGELIPFDNGVKTEIMRIK